MYESYLTMNNECYKIITVLLENNTIVIDMEETTSFVQYKGQYTQEDIEGMLASRIHLTIDQFYDLIKAGLSKSDNHIVLTCEQGLSEGLRLTLVWTIPNSIGLNLPTFMLELVPLIQDDTQRLNKVIMGLNQKIMDGSKKNEKLSLKLNRLEMFIDEKDENQCKAFTMLMDKTSSYTDLFKNKILEMGNHFSMKDTEMNVKINDLVSLSNKYDNNIVEMNSLLNDLEEDIERQHNNTIDLEEDIKNYSKVNKKHIDFLSDKLDIMTKRIDSTDLLMKQQSSHISAVNTAFLDNIQSIETKNNDINTTVNSLLNKIEVMEKKNNDTNAYIMKNIQTIENKNILQEKIMYLTDVNSVLISLISKIEAMKNNLVNITVYKDEERAEFENPVFTMTVNKKLPNTTLLVQANICIHGEVKAETCPIITYGNDVKTITFGQSENYSNNSGYGRNMTCYAIIKGHVNVGEQVLTMNFNAKPYLIKNPNCVDHSNYAGTPTCSIIKVEEIEI